MATVDDKRAEEIRMALFCESKTGEMGEGVCWIKKSDIFALLADRRERLEREGKLQARLAEVERAAREMRKVLLRVKALLPKVREEMTTDHSCDGIEESEQFDKVRKQLDWMIDDFDGCVIAALLSAPAEDPVREIAENTPSDENLRALGEKEDPHDGWAEDESMAEDPVRVAARAILRHIDSSYGWAVRKEDIDALRRVMREEGKP